MNFKNSKTAKAISGIVGLATAVMMMGPAVASAATVEELTAQINALLAQVAALQAAQTSSTPATSGHVYNVDLTVGSKGDDVVALQTFLVSKGFLTMPTGVAMGYFGGLTKAAVAKWQASAGITPTAGYVGLKSRAALNALVVVPPTPPVVPGTGVSATLDTTSPAGGTLISPQGVATLAVFKLTNAGSAAAKVTMIKFQRTGVSSDSTLNNVYLYQGATRLTDSASIATGMIPFTDTAGIVTIPAGGSVAVAVRADVASGMAGQTVGVMLTDVTTDAGAVTGLPVSGAQHTMTAQPAGMTTADFTGSFSPASGAIDPQNDYVIWQKSINVGSRDANLSSIRFQQLGSVGADDVKNFRLMIDGVVVGGAVEKVDANRYVTFALPTPAVVKAGTHVVKVMVDVVGGSTRTVQLSLRRAIDVELTDSQLGVAVTPTVGSAAFSAIQQTTAISINAGSLTITKATDSTSGNVVLQGSAVTLAKYTLHAAGEKMKVENLTIGWTGTSSGAKLRNGALFANGVQIGATQDVLTTAAGGTLFNLGSSLEVIPGTDVTLEVRADIYNSGTLGQFVANDVITVATIVGTSNVYGKSSLQYSNSAPVAANQVTVAAGSVTLAKYSAYANQTVVVPQTAYKVGEFRLTTGATEGVNLDTITLGIAVTGGAVTDLSNLYVVYGSKTTQTKAAGAASQSWSISEAVAANTTITVAVYSTVSSAFSSGTIIPTVTMSGTSQQSGNAITSAAVAGQTITVGTGLITSALDASTPVSALVVANSMPKVASFKFTTSNEAYTVTELTAKVASAAGAAAIKNIVFKDGGTTIATQPMNGIYATSTGLTVSVPLNGTKVIDVYADLGGIGTGFASTSVNVGVTLDGFEFKNSNGVKDRNYTDRAGNAQYAYKTKPTITNAALPTYVLAPGEQTIGKITITADAGGTIAWREIVWNYATATPSGTVTVTSPRLADEYGTTITGLDFSITGAGKITASSTAGAADQEVSGSKTYSLMATIGGTGLIAGSSVSTNIATGVGSFAASVAAASVAGSPSFLWSDESSSPHSELTQDWNNDYLVKNIPTTSQTLSK